MPQESNRVTLHVSEKDQWGLPAPNFHYDDHPNDIATGTADDPTLTIGTLAIRQAQYIGEQR